MMTPSNNGTCGRGRGSLPGCAPLANPYVPFQMADPPKYEAGKALIRGTLFPGLDLPFLNMVNKTNPYAGTPLGELMALDFVAKELNLYLDTHPDDKEAFRYLQEVLKLIKEGRRTYIQRCGPVRVSDLEQESSFNWLQGPWPWQCAERNGD